MSCSGPIPTQNLQGNAVQGVVYSHMMLKMDFHYSYRFSLEKTQQIDISHAMVTSIFTNPFS